MSEAAQLWSANLAKDAVYRTGLRSFMEYRDLGIEKATHGQFRAHVIRIGHDPGRRPAPLARDAGPEPVRRPPCPDRHAARPEAGH